MQIQVFSEYLQLAQAGRVNFLACPMHKEDEPAIFQLTHLQEKENSVLQCFACGYKIIAGQQLYENIINEINSLGN